MRRPGPEGRLQLRPARFEDVPALLRLIERAIDRGCRQHYGPAQRRAVFLAYAGALFVEVLAPFETVVGRAGHGDDRIVGMAQLDPQEGRLRALFVDGEAQGHGFGAELLAWVEARARAHGHRFLHGAMSLNAVPFYAHAGFRPYTAREVIHPAGIEVPIVPMEKPLEPPGPANPV